MMTIGQVVTDNMKTRTVIQNRSEKSDFSIKLNAIDAVEVTNENMNPIMKYVSMVILLSSCFVSNFGLES